MRLLTVKNISMSYRQNSGFRGAKQRFKVLEDISFSLEEGQCLGIVGESGSGKSTLGKLVLGLEKPDSGTVLFQGVDMHRAAPKHIYAVRRDLQAVFQDSYHALNPRMKAGRIISEPLLNYMRLSESELSRMQGELLEAVGLRPEDADKFPHQFSGGQQQRMNIARALALRPKLIVLDEAVSSLDMMLQAQILELLLDLKRRLGLSYLFISHDMKATRHLSDRLIVMDRGSLVESVDRIDELDDCIHPASRRLLDSQLPEHPRDRSRSG